MRSRDHTIVGFCKCFHRFFFTVRTPPRPRAENMRYHLPMRCRKPWSDLPENPVGRSSQKARSPGLRRKVRQYSARSGLRPVCHRSNRRPAFHPAAELRRIPRSTGAEGGTAHTAAVFLFYFLSHALDFFFFRCMVSFQEAGHIPSEQRLHQSHQTLQYVVIKLERLCPPASVFFLNLLLSRRFFPFCS